MTTAPTIVQLKYNWSTDRASAPIVAIVAHNTVGTDSRAYLSRGGDAPDGSDRKVSIHSLIRKDGVLYRYVPDERGANHAGFGKMPSGYPALNPNRVTIGFELENASDGRAHVDEYPDVQLLTMGWEINRIRAKFGHLPIFRHAQIDPDRRRDTAGLSVEQMEKWANAAAVVFSPVSLPAGSITPASYLIWEPRATQAQCVAYILSRPHGEYDETSVRSIVQSYYANATGLDPLLAIAQMIHETGCMTSWWSQRGTPDAPRRNPAGLGVTGETSTKPLPGYVLDGAIYRRGLAFESWAMAARSHLGRLLAYALPANSGTPQQQALASAALALRPLPAEVPRGCAPTLVGLDGKWAQPGKDYAERLCAIANAIRGM